MVAGHVEVVRMLHLDVVVGNDYHMGTLLEHSSFDPELAAGASHEWSFRAVDSRRHHRQSRGHGLWRDV